MLTRPIPSTGEAIPVIGFGTWRAFDVGTDEATRRPLREVLRLFLDGGGRIIDSSPMYGRAEAVTGDLLRRVRGRPLPDWAGEFDCTSWAQLFLKYVLAEPAVTCVIPATGKSRAYQGQSLGRFRPIAGCAPTPADPRAVGCRLAWPHSGRHLSADRQSQFRCQLIPLVGLADDVQIVG